ncbi:hypothetical protein [Phytohabitans aurantiacus]|jgi:ketosteroid isomerase-like protein|uniref:SnoaL-like domain-containing protein n=1 Tax=Phytohabitans aurantiacus TaxID=3016789 RepID=A0ABQ5QPK2_9ACTN|nr:hypothetical protein [Phytohabitans aurantiacus]GLH96493.1 hypothetical protein Pa4123_17670 [Phytohabitans aurantiacus]
MAYQSPAHFCAEYAKDHSPTEADESDAVFTLEKVTVVSETADTARVEALWFACGHEPDSGYYDVFERFAFILVKRDDGWRLHATENLGYE